MNKIRVKVGLQHILISVNNVVDRRLNKVTQLTPSKIEYDANYKSVRHCLLTFYTLNPLKKLGANC